MRGQNLILPLNNESDGMFASNRDTISAIRQGILNILLTRKNERLVKNDIGLSTALLGGVLFEPTNSFDFQDKMLTEIRQQLDTYLIDEEGNPKVRVDDLRVYTKELNPDLVFEDNTIKVKLLYTILLNNNIDNTSTNQDAISFNLN